jgi:uroporphyrinogen decarboxylase
MGVNAAQLLLSRLDSQVGLQPRQVVLPARLIVRHSCGSRLRGDGSGALSLPLAKDARAEYSSMVKPLGPDERRAFSRYTAGLAISIPMKKRPQSDYDKSDINRLLKAIQHQEADRLPHLELWVKSKAVYEYVLEHEISYAGANGRASTLSIRPEDHVEFALRLGMDAVVCNFSWRPNNIFERAADGSQHYLDGTIKTWADLDDLEAPPSLGDQLSHLERYLRTAQGTGVGVIANFTSFFDSAMRAIGINDALYMVYDNRPLIEKLMDMVLEHQEKVVRAVCDRFADELALVLINDDIVFHTGLIIHPDMFAQMFPQRMRRLIAPAREHDKPVLMHTDGKIEPVLPILYELGFAALHPVQPEFNDIFALKQEWSGKLAFIGNISTTLLATGSEEEIAERVCQHCVRLGPGGGYVLGSSGSIVNDIPPENVVAMTQAVHKYGRYGSLGREA